MEINMVFLNILHVLIAIAVIGFVLVQRGAGATAGAAFGSGASGTVFGARGAGTFLSKTTWILGAAFCAISLTMAVIVSRTDTAPTADLGVVSSVPAAQQSAPESSVPAPAQNTAADENSDLPALEITEEAESGASNAQEQPVDDLPAPADESPESTVEDQGAAATDAGTDTDDS